MQQGGQWLTPPLSSGALPGVMRARGVAMGLIQEARLGESLVEEEPALLLNSLDCRPLTQAAEPPAKQLFEQLLGSD